MNIATKENNLLTLNTNYLWALLGECEGIGRKTLFHIWNEIQTRNLTIQDFWQLCPDEYSAKFNLSQRIIDSIQKMRKNPLSTLKSLETLKKNKIEIHIYPELKTYFEYTKNPPFILYTKGDIHLLEDKTISIASSRNPSKRALSLIAEFSILLSENGFVLVNGAPKEPGELQSIVSQKNKGKEILILAGGIMAYCQNKNLQIDENRHLFISYSPPFLIYDTGAEKQRTAIRFALSKEIIIVEAKKDGNTYCEALNLIGKRRIFVVKYGEDMPTGNKILLEKGAESLTPSASTENLNIITGEGTLFKGNEKKRGLGQYFTPLPVVKFMYKMLKILMEKEKINSPSIIDPACGEGIFIQYAVKEGVASPENIFGCDIDPEVKKRWEKEHIKGNLYIQDGLLDNKEIGIIEGKFDISIGNPPYGRLSLSKLFSVSKKKDSGSTNIFEKNKGGKETLKNNRKEIIRKLNDIAGLYQLWRRINGEEGARVKDGESMLFPNYSTTGSSKKRAEMILDEVEKMRKKGMKFPESELKKLASFPIEVLFLERFVRLIRDGGFSAIIIPDGILANYNYEYVRKWLFAHTRVWAIISLPRDTFKGTGTTQKQAF